MIALLCVCDTHAEANWQKHNTQVESMDNHCLNSNSDMFRPQHATPVVPLSRPQSLCNVGEKKSIFVCLKA